MKNETPIQLYVGNESKQKGHKTMTIKDNATPRPWKYYDTKKEVNYFILTGKPIIKGFDSHQVAKLTEVNRDNVDLIVKAVNNFDALLEAAKFGLERAEAELKRCGGCSGYLEPRIEQAKQAIANATK